jgi:hypothetical protein
MFPGIRLLNKNEVLNIGVDCKSLFIFDCKAETYEQP